MARFLFFTHYAKLYGANRSLLELIQMLRMRGHETLVVLKKQGPFCEKLDELQIPYRVFNFPLWTFEDVRKSERKSLRLLVRGLMQIAQIALHAFFFLFQKNKLRRLVADERIDYIQSNSITFGAGLALAKQTGRPHIWHLRETLSDYNLSPVTGHAALFKKIASSDWIYCISEYQKELLCTAGDALRQHHGRIQVIPNPIAPQERIRQYGEKGKARKLFREAETIFCIAGLVTPNKGQADAIRALGLLRERYPHLRLKIAGEVLDKSIPALIRSLGLEDRVELLGHVESVWDEVYLQSDASLMCSRHEAFGRVTIESMICRRPVIGYRGGATPEILSSEDYGLLYESVEELAAQMQRLIENPEQAEAMAERAFAEIVPGYVSEEHLVQFLAPLNL
ncbi:MAG: glycosyltransferase family 4 protein [Lewinellaceae bacterium]|nr:glycosyltransferase family 4 protein [Lewinellaceae bacterium]